MTGRVAQGLLVVRHRLAQATLFLEDESEVEIARRVITFERQSPLKGSARLSEMP